MSSELKAFPTAVGAAEACGAAIFDRIVDARRQRGTAAIAVSGGNTPRIMFEWMAKQEFDWKGVDLFWVDERCVPVDDPQSNFGMTRASLLDAIKLPPAQIHRIHGELLPDEAAVLYIEDIRRSFRLRDGELPVFDVIQRGMGPDTHTASLFPGEPLLANRTGIAAAVWVDKLKQHRVTLLPGVLERARETFCLVTGSDKKDALRRVLAGPVETMEVPSGISTDKMIWFVDEAAAVEQAISPRPEA